MLSFFCELFVGHILVTILLISTLQLRDFVLGRISSCAPTFRLFLFSLRASRLRLFTSKGRRHRQQYIITFPCVYLSSGRCVCTSGLSYITIDNYKSRNNRTQDDVRFEFKSSQSSGMIMYAKGIHRDSIYVAYKDSRVFMLYIDLGTGNEFVSFLTAQLMVFAFIIWLTDQYPKT